MPNSTPTQLRFDPSAGFTIRADFEGGGLSSDPGSLIAAVLRPGKRPTGAENAMIMKRVLKSIRQRFSDTHILVRGEHLL